MKVCWSWAIGALTAMLLSCPISAEPFMGMKGSVELQGSSMNLSIPSNFRLAESLEIRQSAGSGDYVLMKIREKDTINLGEAVIGAFYATADTGNHENALLLGQRYECVIRGKKSPEGEVVVWLDVLDTETRARVRSTMTGIGEVGLIYKLLVGKHREWVTAH